MFFLFDISAMVFAESIDKHLTKLGITNPEVQKVVKETLSQRNTKTLSDEELKKIAKSAEVKINDNIAQKSEIKNIGSFENEFPMNKLNDKDIKNIAKEIRNENISLFQQPESFLGQNTMLDCTKSPAPIQYCCETLVSELLQNIEFPNPGLFAVGAYLAFSRAAAKAGEEAGKVQEITLQQIRQEELKKEELKLGVTGAAGARKKWRFWGRSLAFNFSCCR